MNNSRLNLDKNKSRKKLINMISIIPVILLSLILGSESFPSTSLDWIRRDLAERQSPGVPFMADRLSQRFEHLLISTT